jgi:methanogenic corrinoid protein MtbC1
MAKPQFSIASVERDVGLSKDVLRVWERRYGFPTPSRDENGERLYSAEQVDRLRLVKRLMDQGHRPGRLLAAPLKERRALAAPRAGTEPAATDEALADLVGVVQRHEAEGFAQGLRQRLGRQGLHRFVQDTVAPLSQLIGAAWEAGRLQVFEEHLFTEITERVLRQAIAAVPGGSEPRVLLTSVPGEQHALGLLMAEAVLCLEGAMCIPLGTQTPVTDIARAASAHRADIVALSFSASFRKRQIPALLQQLRVALPSRVRLWAGGSGMRGVAPPEGVLIVGALPEAATAVAQWRADHAS